jgi:HAD superfamily hydrolase (TIGR01458 family)
VGFVGRRLRSTFSASRSCSTTRSIARSRLSHWLRSSCATARSTGPAFAVTRRFCAGVSDDEASTSNTASARDSVFWACWPPGPLEREKRSSISERGTETDLVTRIDSPAMAAILLDIDGVFHVSGNVIAGGARAIQELRDRGHRLRFLTNNTTRARLRLAEEIRSYGVELGDEELQTTAVAAGRILAGRRVLALTMPAIREDLEGPVLVGEDADVVLLGGADESAETNQVFSYMNLARAFAELENGAELYCLHKNPWWQTSRGVLLDAGAFVAGLEYAAGTTATVLGKPSASYFAAALEALDADAEHAWMIGDDVDADIGGAAALGIRTILVRTGKFRDDAGAWSAQPDAVVDTIADVPAFLESAA